MPILVTAAILAWAFFILAVSKIVESLADWIRCLRGHP